MDIQLTPGEIQDLRRIQKKGKFHRRRFIKATVLLMLHRGVSIDMICASLSLDEDTVYRYAKTFREKGLKAFLKVG
ncbi:MAG: helix-turn-helix domain-containing protein [Chloroflexi bacterium]|nr:MAG: helix-turn-helix domain-containing protein [Chloroflexota bacterium]